MKSQYRVLSVYYYFNIINCTLYIHSLPPSTQNGKLPCVVSYHWVQSQSFYVLPEVVWFYEDLSCLGYDSM